MVEEEGGVSFLSTLIIHLTVLCSSSEQVIHQSQSSLTLSSIMLLIVLELMRTPGEKEREGRIHSVTEPGETGYIDPSLSVCLASQITDT